MNKLRKELDIYFGYHNEVKLGVVGKKPPLKPPSLITLEQCEAFNVLPEAGGLQDQSYIWLQAAAVCRHVRSVMGAISKQTQDPGADLTL